MRKNTTAWIALVALVLTACAGDGDPTSVVPRAVHEWPLSWVAEVEVLEEVEAPLGASIPRHSVEIRTVYWVRETFVSGREFIPPVEGTIETLTAAFDLKDGATYVVVGGRSGALATNPLTSVAVYDAATMTPGGPAIDPPLETYLAPGETTVAQRLAAFVEFVQQAAAWRDATKRSVADPPVGDRLARVLSDEPVETEALGEDVDPELGMSIDSYLAQSSDTRQLNDFGDLPSEVVESLDLVPLRVIVRFDADFAASHWGIGFRSSAGVYGPTILPPGPAIVDLEGTASRDGVVDVVFWTSDPSRDHTRFMHLAEPIGGIGLIVPEQRPSVNGAVLIDMPAGEVRVLSRREARLLVESEATVGSPKP